MHTAEYLVNGELQDLIIGVHMDKGQVLIIYKPGALRDGAIRGGMDYVYFEGYFVLENGTLYQTLLPAWQKETGITQIIFIQIGEYGTNGESNILFLV